MVLQNLRYALRTLMRSPGFTVVVVLTLGLGIGANTAVFSVVDGVLLERLPFDEPDDLVTLWLDVSRQGGPVREWFNYATFEDVRDEPGLLQAGAVWGDWQPTLTGVGEAEVLVAAEVSHAMFSAVLRVMPEVGRTFIPADDVEGAPGVVMLSHRLWASHFGRDPSIVGRALSLSEVPYTVIGVMPEGFRPPFAQEAALWRALGPSSTLGCARGCFGTRMIGRLGQGVTLERAQAQATALATRLEESFPETNTSMGIAVFGLREDLTRNSARGLWVLLGAVGFVLLIACTNIANLLLARGAARRGEIAVRIALGAERGSIVGQLLTESLVLAALGGVVGITLTAWGTEALLGLAPEGVVPRIDQVDLDGRVFAFTGLLTLATGFLFGLLPAWRTGGDGGSGALRAGLAGKGPGAALRRGLVITQVALALVLLVGSGLMVRSFQRLNSAELGFEPEGVLTMSMALPATRYSDGVARRAYYRALLDRIRSLPGVTAGGAVGSLPLAGADSDASFLVEGEPPPTPGVSQAAWVRPVTDGYFEAVGLELIEGRSFAEGDDADADAVIIINQTLADRYFPGGDAVGRRIGFGSPERPNWRRVVGVAGDVRHFAIRNGTRPAVYFPYGQVSFPAMSVAVRTDGDPMALLSDLRRAVSDLDPALAATQVQPLQVLVDRTLAPERFVTTVLGFFAVAAMLLAALGIHGVMSYGVTRRMREMGIRLALGADGKRVRHLVVRGGLLLAGGGIALGVLGALALTRVLASLLYEVEATDPLTFLSTAALVTGVAAVATWLPAWRAGRTDPVNVLREE
jgi:predicted permease